MGGMTRRDDVDNVWIGTVGQLTIDLSVCALLCWLDLLLWLARLSATQRQTVMCFDEVGLVGRSN